MSPVELAVYTAAVTAAVVALKARLASRRGARDADPDAAAASALAASHGFGAACRGLFALDFSAIHLNHGSYGTSPRAVTAAARALADELEAWPDAYFRRWGLPAYAAACAAVARFVRAPAGSVALLENATQGVACALAAARLGRGDVVLLNDNTYNAVKNAAAAASAAAGGRVAYHTLPLPLPAAPAGAADDALVAAFEAALDAPLPPGERVALAIVDHITSPTGIVMPVRRLVAAARARGVRVCVDGAHAPGQLELDVPSIGADWYTGNLHKWCFTPKGVALLAVAEGAAADATQGVAVSHFWRRPLVDRFFMVGTTDPSRALAAPAALAWVDAALGGWPAVRAHNAALAAAGAAALERAWGTARLLPRHACAPFLVAVRAPLDWRAWARRPAPGGGAPREADLAGLAPADAEAAALADDGFNERPAAAVLALANLQAQFFLWRVGGELAVYCRVSAQVYNTLDEYERLARAVLDIAPPAIE